MEKPRGFDNFKKHYAVYYVGIGSGVYAHDYSRTFVGKTWATSPEQACNNVRYRQKNAQNPHGGYSYDVLGDYADEGIVVFHYEAKEIL